MVCLHRAAHQGASVITFSSQRPVPGNVLIMLSDKPMRWLVDGPLGIVCASTGELVSVIFMLELGRGEYRMYVLLPSGTIAYRIWSDVAEHRVGIVI